MAGFIFDLDIDPVEENLELSQILKKIKKQMFTLNQEVMAKMSFYISERIKKHEPKR